ncbi:MAG: hypothetical protein LZ172_08310 [Thaumarchaeota archaeon]|jgi:phosphoglycerol transferase MdoB-like AlkP superfamily enzyme|nr:hypothetical protein [Candidatus Geocrenenecus arthurdayi]MCL7389948.1 hypothetical protein [Candidatus Geocrenenecus arthurdayi]MCL7391957.1 hypothetical protein [Candidatus Geocrenenecus arthurdayi]MCL7396350.1 hypothetical protein [Candidatus Geocrenenecus arthurdayi]MCL7404327.1 hypothetical protein [Candidatus Geocrenenecus arthurdayi]
MSIKEFFKESTILALLMTTPPISLLILIKIIEPKTSWFSLILWAITAISWMVFVALIYYKKSLKRIRR